MKKTTMVLMLMSLLSGFVFAQSNGTITGVSAKIGNLYHFSKSPLKNYYSLGGEVDLILKNKIHIGLGQYSSFAPSDVLKNNPYNSEKMSVSEYTIQAGYKHGLGKSFYLHSGAKVGYAIFKMEQNSGLFSENTKTIEQTEAVFVSSDMRVGLKLSRYFSIESGLKYRFHFSGDEKWGVSPQKMNGVDLSLALVGNIPF